MPPRGNLNDRVNQLERVEPPPTKPPARDAAPSSSRGKARWIWFTLTEALTTSDESATATVTKFFDGVNPDPSAAGIEVYNRQRSDISYDYEGETNARGYAIYAAKEDKYYIFDLECP